MIFGLIFLVLLPIALMRAIGHDPLKTKKLDLKSYRESKTNNEIDLKGFFNGINRTYQRYMGFLKVRKILVAPLIIPLF